MQLGTFALQGPACLSIEVLRKWTFEFFYYVTQSFAVRYSV